MLPFFYHGHYWHIQPTTALMRPTKTQSMTAYFDNRIYFTNIISYIMISSMVVLIFRITTLFLFVKLHSKIMPTLYGLNRYTVANYG